jgi:hypothetical protein
LCRSFGPSIFNATGNPKLGRSLAASAELQVTPSGHGNAGGSKPLLGGCLVKHREYADLRNVEQISLTGVAEAFSDVRPSRKSGDCIEALVDALHRCHAALDQMLARGGIHILRQCAANGSGNASGLDGVAKGITVRQIVRA